MKSSGRVRVFAAVVLFAGSACAPPPVAPTASPVTAPAAPIAAVAAPTHDPPPRWVATGGLTRLGVVLPQGRLVLVGGRRALVRHDGTTIPETAPAPEPLVQIILVPMPAGDRLVGSGRHAVYRFDDPLGPPAIIAACSDTIGLIGAGPGVVSIWSGVHASTPFFVDPDTGEKKSHDAWPNLPIRQMAFRNQREGVVEFWMLGYGSTTDGGKSFRTLTETVPPAVSESASIARVGDEIQLRHGDAGYTTVDFASGVSSQFAKDAPETAPTLRWIQSTGTDPWAEAIEDGLVESNRSAVVERHGLLARVDLSNGVIEELVAHPDTGCDLASHADRGLLVCPKRSLQSFALGGPRRLAEISVQIPSFFNIFRGKGGALAFEGRCSPDATEDAICALQPDGSFARIDLPSGLTARASLGFGHDDLSVLSDGRVAFLKHGGEYEGPPRIVVLDPQGRVTEMPEIKLSAVDESLDPLGPIELGDDGALHALVDTDADERIVYALRQPVDGKPPTLTDLHAQGGRLRNGHAIAYTKTSLQLSNDDGVTWSEVRGAPLGALWEELPLLDMKGWHMDLQADKMGVGGGGIRVGDYTRVGWDGEAKPPPQTRVPSALMLPRPPSDADAGRPIACTSRKTAALAPPFDAAGRKALFVKLSGPPAPGTRRESSDFGFEYDEPAVRLDFSAPKAKAEAPLRWTLHWMDPREPGEPVHTWSGPAPRTATWSAYLRAAAVARGTAVFFISEGRDTGELVHVSRSGAVRIEPLDRGMPKHEIRLNDDGSVAVWNAEDTRAVLLWKPGEKPRAIASYTGLVLADSVQIGTPVDGAVPVEFMDREDLWVRSVSLKGGSNGPLPLDGWVGMNLDATALRACAKATEGELSMRAPPDTQLDMDGWSSAATIQYDLHRDANGSVCIAAVRAMLLTHLGEPANAAKEDAVRYLFAPLTATGTGFEQGKTPHVRTVRCEIQDGGK